MGANTAAGLFFDVARARRGDQPDSGSAVTIALVEKLSKQTLKTLRDRPRTVGRWRVELQFPDHLFEAVLKHLSRLGMIVVHGKGDGATVERSPDADAKRVMARLADGPENADKTREALGLIQEQMTNAVARLLEARMLRNEQRICMKNWS